MAWRIVVGLVIPGLLSGAMAGVIMPALELPSISEPKVLVFFVLMSFMGIINRDCWLWAFPKEPK